MFLTVTFNPAVDQTMQFEEPLESDRVLRAASARFDAAGKGVNVAQYLTALGRDCAATGVLGGFTGQFVRDRLATQGVPAAFVEVADPTRLNTTALAGGTEYKLNHDGSAVDPETVDAVVETVRERAPDTVVVGGTLPPGVSADAVDAIERAGDWDTVVDADGDTLRALGARYALCAPNREELARATDTDLSTVEACGRAAEAFRADGFDRVMATLGEDGVVLATDSATLHATALEVAVVDTVGAGDALLAGTLAAWADGGDDATALRTGVAAATRLVERPGTAPPAFEPLDALRGQVAVRELDG